MGRLGARCFEPSAADRLKESVLDAVSSSETRGPADCGRAFNADCGLVGCWALLADCGRVGCGALVADCGLDRGR